MERAGRGRPGLQHALGRLPLAFVTRPAQGRFSVRRYRRLWMPVLAVLTVLAAACGAEEAASEPAATTTVAQPEPTAIPAPAAETEPAPVGDTSEPEPVTANAVREDRPRGFTEPEPGVAPPSTTHPTTQAPEPGCHPAYVPCLPNLPGDALDCGDLTADQKPVTVNEIGVDPYQLDRDADGRGCTS